MTFRNKIIQWLALSLLCCNTALALPEDKSQPIQLEADQAKLNNQTGMAEYSGNVVIIQGSAELRADKVILQTENNTITQMKAFGSPAKYQQILQPGEEPTHIEGLKLDLELEKEVAKVTGQGRIYRGSDVLEGESITYSLSSGQLSAGNSEEGSSNGRVKMVFHPNSAPESPKTPESPNNDSQETQTSTDPLSK